MNPSARQGPAALSAEGATNLKMKPEQHDIGELQFMNWFNWMQLAAYAVNVRNGWWSERNQICDILESNNIDNTPHMLIECLGLAGTELSEAIEAVRKHDPKTWGDASSKDTLVRELAGCIVRIMDIASHEGLPLAEAIIQEVRHNETRGHMHGGKRA